MDASTEILFTDPVLQRIFFDRRRFAPRSDRAAGEIAGLHMEIAKRQVKFLKADRMAIGEYWQRKMRSRWFVIRRLSDGYFMQMPAGVSGEHVVQFEHENASLEFHVDYKKRVALWHRYERRAPPHWGPVRRRHRGRH